jgi:hypothetical protein
MVKHGREDQLDMERKRRVFQTQGKTKVLSTKIQMRKILAFSR